MTNTLSSLLDATRERLPALRARRDEIERAAARRPASPSWEAAFAGSEVHVIAEVKRYSPSAGAIAPELIPSEHAAAYVRGGARAVSVLTEAKHFGGAVADLERVAATVAVPVLRKDFIIDPIQLYEARAAGAAAVLLIVRALDPGRLDELAAEARRLGLGCLIEVHEDAELEAALRCSPASVGVNARDLGTFALDLSVVERVLGAIPPDVVAVAESGMARREDVERVAAWGADAVLVGTAVARAPDPEAAVRDLVGVRSGSQRRSRVGRRLGGDAMSAEARGDRGRFGLYGGRYVPETLMAALEELAATYDEASHDAAFRRELDLLLTRYAGRPTPLTDAPRLSDVVGCRVLLKREDLAHTGAHKINNTLGQALLACRMGKRRVIAETGAGQHGVATATACARLGLECVVYMGAEDMDRQRLNVFRMELLGATVVPVTSGTRTLKDATNEALRDWVTNVHTTHYAIGSVVGPDPFPRMVRDFQSVIGRETRAQALEQVGRLPDTVVACVGGGSNALGIYHAFLDDASVALVGVEAGGTGLPHGRHAATLAAGRPGVLHGSLSYLLQDEDGQVRPAHSVSAGLDYPGVGPEHSYLRDSGRVRYFTVTDQEALAAFGSLSRLEGILPALESAHALAWIQRQRDRWTDSDVVVMNLSGRGDKDVQHVASLLSEPS